LFGIFPAITATDGAESALPADLLLRLAKKRLVPKLKCCIGERLGEIERRVIDESESKPCLDRKIVV